MIGIHILSQRFSVFNIFIQIYQLFSHRAPGVIDTGFGICYHKCETEVIPLKKVFFITVLLLCLVLCSCASDAAIPRGTLANNVYINEDAGIRFAPGPDWIFEDAPSLEDKSADDTVCDMSARDPSGSVYVDVNFVKEGKYPGAGRESVDVYIDELKLSLEETFGGKVSEEKDTKAVLSGIEYSGVSLVIDDDGGRVCQFYYIRKAEGYFVSVSASVFDEKYDSDYVVGLFENINDR